MPVARALLMKRAPILIFSAFALLFGCGWNQRAFQAAEALGWAPSH
jgi:hypothetical protein